MITFSSHICKMSQPYQPYSAMREACETKICPGEQCNWNPKCMEKCFKEQVDAIVSCCKEECPDDSLGYDECGRACETALTYVDDPDAPIQLNIRKTHRVLTITTLLVILISAFFVMRDYMRK
jgi:hypothetical protein